MTGDTNSKLFLKATKDRIMTTERDKLVSEVTQAIGERRCRDLLDLIAGIEKTKDWKTAVSILMDASDRSYKTPFTIQNKNKKIESLKYREVIFELLSCPGLEPIPETTISLLQNVESKKSFAQASTMFEEYALNQAIEEIRNRNTLFFELPHNHPLYEKHRSLLEERRKEELECLRLSNVEGKINIDQLWATSYGRRALSELGITGFQIDYSDIEVVLSVLQIPQSVKEQLKAGIKKARTVQSTNVGERISNPDYSQLLKSLIEQDTQIIRLQGSRHAVPTLNALLFEALSQYRSSQSSDKYRQIVHCLSDLTLIRSPDSFTTYEILTNLRDLRITTLAISALGNYYHDSATAILIDLLCATRMKWIIQASLEALSNQIKKHPQAKYSIKAAIDSGCKNAGDLEHLIKQYGK